MSILDPFNEPLERIATALKERHLSAKDLTQFCMNRISQLNPHLNAITQDCFEQAQAHAAAIDADIARGSTSDKPLLGVPFVVSANIGIAGMRQDLGTWALHGQRASKTATVVERLIRAGAIPLALGNIGELGLGSETVNPIYGRTGNPWRRFRSPGGSNGGVAALIAANACAFGIANDFGAALRVPAAFCGLYGHKPSRGVVPLSGQFPFFKPEDEISWRAYDSIGPMTRHAQDLRLVLDIISGPCAQDPMSMTGTRQDFFGSFVKQKIALLSNPRVDGARTVGPGIRLAIRKAGQLMQEAGADLVDVHEDLFFEAADLWRHAVHRAVEGKFRQIFGGGKARKPKMELLKVFLGQGDHSLTGCMQMFSEEFRIDVDKMRSLDSDIARLRKKLDKIFSESMILITPTFPRRTPRHFFSIANPADAALSSMINVLGLPATTAPMGVSGDGLPVAVQLIAAAGHDAMTIEAAKLIGNFIPPPMAHS